MKNSFKSIILILSIVGITSCNSNKNVTNKDSETEVVTENLPDGSQNSEEKTITVRGEVSEITMGKDGYTAILKAENGIYFATISIPNMKDPKDYRSVKIGEMIEVTGESWKMENDNYIRVTEMKK